MPPGTVAAPVNEWDPQEQHLVSYGERRAEHLFHVILGPKAETPVDDIEPPAKVRTVIKLVEPEVILAVYRKVLEFEQNQSPAKKGEKRTILRDAKTRTRLMVRASTGRRPSEIMRAEPDDVDLSNRVWRVRDGKGGWSEGLSER